MGVGVMEWILWDIPLHQVKYELLKTVGVKEVGLWEY
jgi:hypothetical protein